MRKAVYSLWLVLAAVPVQAANLWYVGDNPNASPPDHYYADLDSAYRKGDIVMVRTVLVVAKPATEEGIGLVLQDIAVNAINCKTHTIAVLSVDSYGLQNRLLKHETFPADFYPLQGLDAIVANKVCR